MKLSSGSLVVEVDPERGGEIAQVTARGTPLLFAWEPREGGGDDSASHWLRRYRGGWQTIFPNGGEESEGIGFHGFACLTPYEHRSSANEIAMRAHLDGFDIERVVRIEDASIDVLESITSFRSCDVMWSHHPAFGAPFLSPECAIKTNAREFLSDAVRDLGDLRPGARSEWPFGVSRDGSAVDLRRLPDPGDRFGYLIDCSEVSISNPTLGIEVRLAWEGFDHAWYWLEAHATEGFPWYRDAYVFGIEPASSFPGHGIASVKESHGPLVHFDAGEKKSVRVRMHVECF
ncbi:MAG: aldose epimerase family protein [Actinomycetota bacterium]